MGVIIQFPYRPREADNAMLVGQHIRDAFPLPARDDELALLVQMADSLLSNLTDDACDRFLSRLDAWEQENRKG